MAKKTFEVDFEVDIKAADAEQALDIVQGVLSEAGFETLDKFSVEDTTASYSGEVCKDMPSDDEQSLKLAYSHLRRCLAKHDLVELKSFEILGLESQKPGPDPHQQNSEKPQSDQQPDQGPDQPPVVEDATTQNSVEAKVSIITADSVIEHEDQIENNQEPASGQPQSDLAQKKEAENNAINTPVEEATTKVDESKAEKTQTATNKPDSEAAPKKASNKTADKAKKAEAKAVKEKTEKVNKVVDEARGKTNGN